MTDMPMPNEAPRGPQSNPPSRHNLETADKPRHMSRRKSFSVQGMLQVGGTMKCGKCAMGNRLWVSLRAHWASSEKVMERLCMGTLKLPTWKKATELRLSLIAQNYFGFDQESEKETYRKADRGI